MSDKRRNIQLELAFMAESRGEAPKAVCEGTESRAAKHVSESPALTERIMEEVCLRENLKKALQRVRQNKGSPGTDGMTVSELPDYLTEHWATIRDSLLRGTYKPQPVKRVEIPKPGGGMRKLGIPTVLDRFVQQAILQVLQAHWDATFSEQSYGFRPGRSAHQAVAKAQQYVSEGHAWVVDIDLEKFFDRVNHDMLMGRIAKRVSDKRLLKVLRAFLNAGVMENGLVGPTVEGTPQGGPLSPLLSNIVLDDLDRELERRGHRFVRYADDCNIHVRSERAGQRVMESITRFITRKLKLKVNKSKSKVDRPQRCKFLGFRFVRNKTFKRGLAPQTVQRFKRRVRELLLRHIMNEHIQSSGPIRSRVTRINCVQMIGVGVVTRRTRGVSLERMVEQLSRYLVGWRGYFGFCETPSVLRDLDSWIRRRLRCVVWQKWKRGRRRFAELRARDVGRDLTARTAGSVHGPWRISRSPALSYAFPNAYFTTLGLPLLVLSRNA